jgi:hypothetical protein
MTEKRRVGRPRTRTDEAPGDYVGFRAPRNLKDKLEAAAARAGRSLSTEVQFRLENSFRNERLLDEALDIAHGRQTAAFLQVLAETVRHASDHAAWITALAGHEETRPADWLLKPYLFEIVARHLTRAIEALRPPGDVSAPLLDLNGQDLSGIFHQAGAARVLDALIDAPNAVRQELSVWAKPIAEKLGPELVERIRAKERAPDGDQIAKLRSNR